MYLSTNAGDCAGLGCSQGMGALTMDGTGLMGTGLFSGGLDLSTWGAGEIAALAFGAFVLFSVFSTTERGYQTAKRRVRRVVRRRSAVVAA